MTNEELTQAFKTAKRTHDEWLASASSLARSRKSEELSTGASIEFIRAELDADEKTIHLVFRLTTGGRDDDVPPGEGAFRVSVEGHSIGIRTAEVPDLWKRAMLSLQLCFDRLSCFQNQLLNYPP